MDAKLDEQLERDIAGLCDIGLAKIRLLAGPPSRLEVTAT